MSLFFSFLKTFLMVFVCLFNSAPRIINKQKQTNNKAIKKTIKTIRGAEYSRGNELPGRFTLLFFHSCARPIFQVIREYSRHYATKLLALVGLADLAAHVMVQSATRNLSFLLSLSRCVRCAPIFLFES